MRTAALRAAEFRAQQALLQAEASEPQLQAEASKGAIGLPVKARVTESQQKIRSSTGALALAAQADAARCAERRAKVAAASRRLAEDFQKRLAQGLDQEKLRRIAVGLAEDPRRSCINHDAFSNFYWEQGHQMNIGPFQHQFSFKAFRESMPGTQRFTVGCAGAHVSGGPLRCLVTQSTNDASGCHPAELAQHGFTPQLSFWAFMEEQPGTFCLLLFVSYEGPVRSLLVTRSSTFHTEVPGFKVVCEVWVFPDSNLNQDCTKMKWSKHSGYISGGDDLAVERITISQAKMRSGQILGCQGFTFNSAKPLDVDETGETYEIVFKGKWDLFVDASWTSFRCHRVGDFDPEVAAKAALEGQLPQEYSYVRQSLCIPDELLAKCEVLRIADHLQTRYQFLPSADIENIHDLVLAACCRAFPDACKAHERRIEVHLLHDDDAPRVELVGQIAKMFSHEACTTLHEWRARLLPAIVTFLVEDSDPGDASAALLLLGYCSWRLFDRAICPVMARRCFDKCLLSLKLHGQSVENTLTADCRNDFRNWLLRYLEVHKGRALISAFLEPCKLYWRRLFKGGSVQEADVEAHAANIFSGLVEKILCVRCPIPVSWEDPFGVHGIVEFLNATFLSGALQATQRLENFGQSYAKLIRTRSEGDGQAFAVYLAGVRFIFAGARSPEEIVTRALSPGMELQAERQALLPYLRRFAHYFTEDFFLEAACSAALADTVGGKLSCARSVRMLVEDQNLSVFGETLPESDEDLCQKFLWTFDENSFPLHFNKEAARQLFQFVGFELMPSTAEGMT